MSLKLGIIFYLGLLILGHQWHGSIDAIKRIHLTRSLLTRGSMITEEYGAVKYGPLQSIAMIPPYALGYFAGKATGHSPDDSSFFGYRVAAMTFVPVICCLIAIVAFGWIIALGY